MTSTDSPLSDDEIEIAKDIFQKLKETNQIYIVGHDYPISVSKHIFNGLSKALDAYAVAKSVPRIEVEMEDLFGMLLGYMPLTEIEMTVMKVVLARK